MSDLGVFFLFCAMALIAAWVVNFLVGLLSGEHPGDTRRVWWEILFRSLAVGDLALIDRILNYRNTSWARENPVKCVIGIFMVLACGAAGLVDAFLLAGAGICGFPLTRGIFLFGIVTALLPAGTVRVFAGRWRLPALIYSAPLALPALTGVLMEEWHRDMAVLACTAIAFGGAWLAKHRSSFGIE